MFNHNRGLWGYTGAAADGEPLTIQSTGMGGPSAAIVIAELADLGVSRLIRVGTCGALVDRLALGDLLIAGEALSDDGASSALGAGDRVAACPALVQALHEVGGGALSSGTVASTDLFYDDRREPERRWAELGAIAVEMETATLFALAARRELQAASLLIVSDLLLPTRVRVEADALREAEHRLGELAARALMAEKAGARTGFAG